ncbi:glycerophosphodiester phosphodiesterase family protein [Bartonella sp. LJL80]
MRLDWLTTRPIAHRGLHDFNKSIWENTLQAFEFAALSNYAICCDVQLSRDGVPIIFHGPSLERLCNRRERIIDLRAVDIANLRFGDGKQQIIPLQKMLEAIAGKVPVLVNLEGNEGLDVGLISTVTELLTHFDNKSAVMSQDIHLLRRIRISNPTIPHGIKAEGNQRKDIEEHFAMLAHDMEFVAYNHRELFNPFVRFAKQKLDMPILAWTIQSRDEWDKASKNADQMIFEGFDPDREEKRLKILHESVS